MPKNLRFTQEFIWDMLEPALSPSLPEDFKDLYFCFNNERDFYKMLGILSGQQNLEEYVRPTIKPYILNSYFAENGGPIRYEEIKEYLTKCTSESVKNIDNAILYLEDQQHIRIEGENIWPLNLRKFEATAFVLANHPAGLSWQDIAKCANNGKYSKTVLSLLRPDAALYESENIYLAGPGTFKHAQFIDFDSLNIETIFDELLIYLDKTNRYTFVLNECYRASPVLQEQDYYVIRYIVKHYGKKYGFFFDGRSQVDSIGIEAGFKRSTQKDVILEAMKSNNKPMTIALRRSSRPF